MYKERNGTVFHMGLWNGTDFLERNGTDSWNGPERISWNGTQYPQYPPNTPPQYPPIPPIPPIYMPEAWAWAQGPGPMGPGPGPRAPPPLPVPTPHLPACLRHINIWEVLGGVGGIWGILENALAGIWKVYGVGLTNPITRSICDIY